ncbi:hypothetical protein ACMFWY_14485 [Roseiconus sp. JC912]|uniref:hypothetical protein n=1 Tax=Roseiconus sp. JC912 TaxID=3396307 RepID=UPI003A4C53F8
MIAPLEQQTKIPDRVYDGSEHLEGARDNRLNKVVVSHPKAAMVAALTTGMVIGWIVKRTIR